MKMAGMTNFKRGGPRLDILLGMHPVNGFGGSNKINANKIIGIGIFE